MRSTQQARVLATTAAAVASLYDDCWWRTPPARARDLARTETWALRQGWADASCWDGKDLDDPQAEPAELVDLPDPVAIAQTVAGRSVDLTRAEQRLVAAELTRRGASAEATAAAIGRSARTVVRYRRAVEAP